MEFDLVNDTGSSLELEIILLDPPPGIENHPFLMNPGETRHISWRRGKKCYFELTSQGEKHYFS